MINEKVLELINRDLDGTLTKGEKEELAGLLEKDSESKEMLFKLQRLHKTLGEVRQVEPPADIKENVMRALPVTKHSVNPQSYSVFSKVVDLFAIPRFQMAGMFSLGAAAALLFLVITQNFGHQSPNDSLIGTIIAPSETADAVQIDLKHVEISGYYVTIKTSRLDQTVYASISVNAGSNDLIQILAQSEGAEKFRFTGLEYSAPSLVYSNFGNGFFSAAVIGPSSWLLAFEDPDKTAAQLEIELKTETESTIETVAIQ